MSKNVFFLRELLVKRLHQLNHMYFAISLRHLRSRPNKGWDQRVSATNKNLGRLMTPVLENHLLKWQCIKLSTNWWHLPFNLVTCKQRRIRLRKSILIVISTTQWLVLSLIYGQWIKTIITNDSTATNMNKNDCRRNCWRINLCCKFSYLVGGTQKQLSSISCC